MPTNWPEQLQSITKPPETVADAVDRLMTVLDSEHKLAIATLTEDDLIYLHFSLGMAIRNAFRLHDKDNPFKITWAVCSPRPCIHDHHQCVMEKINSGIIQWM